MKKDLIRLLINDCCKGRDCNECPFLHLKSECYLTEIIEIIKKYEKE